jgi:asparagine synthase (glutamine-hydrolysing)
MIADADGEVLAVLTYSGELYNYRQLRRELESLGHVFHSRSDTEVVLRAYLEWGDACPRRFDGMFAFAVWDARVETLVLVRDRLGIKPLYYSVAGSAVLFGSEQKAILAHPSVSTEIGADGLIESLELIKTPGHGVFRGLSELPPGHAMRVTRQGLSPQRYWTFEALPHRAEPRLTPRVVRELLHDAVGAQSCADVPVCALLSGGIDSSAIAALAALPRTDGGAPVRETFTVDFVRSGDGPCGRAQGDDDGPYVAELVNLLGASHTNVVLGPHELAGEDARRCVVAALDAPISRGDFDVSLYLLFARIRSTATVAISGEGADELFGGYSWFHDDHVSATTYFPWFAADDRARYSVLHEGVLRALNVEEYRATCYAGAVASVPTLREDTPVRRRSRTLAHLHLTRFLPSLLDRKDRLSMACGLEVRVPFCDHRMVEAVFNAPWACQLGGGREKELLRAAVAPLLPASITERRKSPYPVTPDPLYDELLRRQLTEILADADRPTLDLVDHAAITRLATVGGSGRAARAAMEFVLHLDRWLTQYKPRIVL